MHIPGEKLEKRVVEQVWHQNPVLLTLIAVFKLLKALMLVVVGVALLKMIHHNAHDTFEAWIRSARLDPDNQIIHGLLAKTFWLNDKRLAALGLGTFVYAALYGIEGVGLLMDKLWAEWLAALSTAGFIPFEFHHMLHHFTPLRLGLLVLNVLVVIYLIHRLRQRYHARRRVPAPARA